jgi:phenylpyruvate tautomerase PptA (4-oxalocrotonate tautomerase family)
VENAIDEASDASISADELSRRQFMFLVGMTGITAVTPLTLFADSDQLNADPNSFSTESDNMPLVRFDAFEGRSEAQVKTLLDSAHKAIVKAFHLNERDRYQVYNARPRAHFIMQDTGLGIPRTDKALIITVMSKQRPEILKRRLYQEMTQELSRSAGIPPSDVMICIVENSAADWTFGNGDAQFLTGDLG